MFNQLELCWRWGVKKKRELFNGVVTICTYLLTSWPMLLGPSTVSDTQTFKTWSVSAFPQTFASTTSRNENACKWKSLKYKILYEYAFRNMNWCSKEMKDEQNKKERGSGKLLTDSMETQIEQSIGWI